MNHSERLDIRITPEQRQQLAGICTRDSVTASEFVRKMIEEHAPEFRAVDISFEGLNSRTALIESDASASQPDAVKTACLVVDVANYSAWFSTVNECDLGGQLIPVVKGEWVELALPCAVDALELRGELEGKGIRRALSDLCSIGGQAQVADVKLLLDHHADRSRLTPVCAEEYTGKDAEALASMDERELSELAAEALIEGFVMITPGGPIS